MSIIALYHMKGGVGKTAAAVNLAYLSAQEGFPTLLCDMDPQASASYYFRIRPSKKHRAGKLLQGTKKLASQVKGTDYDNLDALPSHLSYRNLDIHLDSMKGSKKQLRDLLNPLTREYKYIFLDSPPNITLVSENIFRAADLILVPVIPTTLSILALDRLIGFFNNKKLNHKNLKAFLSMVEKRKSMHQDICEQNRRNPQFFKTRIPYAAVVEKMGIHREPVFSYAQASAAAQAYRELWREVQRWERRR